MNAITINKSPISVQLPLYGYISAGFMAPAADVQSENITLDDWISAGRVGTFMLQVESDYIDSLGIYPGDYVVVDRGRDPKRGDIVLIQLADRWHLEEYRPDYNYPCLHDAEDELFQVAAVVVAAIRRYH